jgi:predicted enzyme related to lactoylglutathione lyase
LNILPLPPATRRPWLSGIALRWALPWLAVSDFATIAQTLQAQGIHFIGPAYRSDDGGTQFDFFLDPEGNRLQLVQRARPLGS